MCGSFFWYDTKKLDRSEDRPSPNFNLLIMKNLRSYSRTEHSINEKLWGIIARIAKKFQCHVKKSYICGLVTL